MPIPTQLREALANPLHPLGFIREHPFRVCVQRGRKETRYVYRSTIAGAEYDARMLGGTVERLNSRMTWEVFR